MSKNFAVSIGDLLRAACCLATGFLMFPQIANACETSPNLHVEVTTKFDAPAIREDYSIAAIEALARQQHRDAGRPLLGFYTSKFDYTIDVVPQGDVACPTRIETQVTLRLQHRLIEIGQEVAANSCVYPSALRHYRDLAEVDERTVERFSARTAALLGQAAPTLKQTYAPYSEDLDAALRNQIRVVVDDAIVTLSDARQEAQQAVSNIAELEKLASSCSI